MAIKSSTFSGWHLSGEDADAFIRQLETEDANLRAIASLKKGKQLAQEFEKNGSLSLSETPKCHRSR